VISKNRVKEVFGIFSLILTLNSWRNKETSPVELKEFGEKQNMQTLSTEI